MLSRSKPRKSRAQNLMPRDCLAAPRANIPTSHVPFDMCILQPIDHTGDGPDLVRRHGMRAYGVWKPHLLAATVTRICLCRPRLHWKASSPSNRCKFRLKLSKRDARPCCTQVSDGARENMQASVPACMYELPGAPNNGTPQLRPPPPCLVTMHACVRDIFHIRVQYLVCHHMRVPFKNKQTQTRNASLPCFDMHECPASISSLATHAWLWQLVQNQHSYRQLEASKSRQERIMLMASAGTRCWCSVCMEMPMSCTHLHICVPVRAHIHDVVTHA
jgi:hypothetical protein